MPPAFGPMMEEEDALVALEQDIVLDSDGEDEEAGDSMIWDSSSDEEEPEKKKSANKKRDFMAAHQQVVSFYFNGRESVYDEKDFERRFRMPRSVFDKIRSKLMGTEPFVHFTDPTGKIGIFPLVKLVACLRYIAYGDAFDRDDENLAIGETTLRNIAKAFCKLMIKVFGGEFLNRAPTSEERRAISRVNKGRGFPGCLSSWDCKHFVWSNCPVRLHGQHQGHAEGGKKTLVLEAIADHRKYFWHCNFGSPGSLNDINILDGSSIVFSMLTLKVDPYMINGRERDWMYFLVDGIYPEWAIFVTTFSDKSDARKKKFAQAQEAVRKDVECAFGILVKRFHVLARPLRGWHEEDLKDLVHCCVILHNMITVAREGSVASESDSENDNVEQAPGAGGFVLFGRHEVTQEEAEADGLTLQAARMAAFDLRKESQYEHMLLKKDLVEHINNL